MQLRKKLILFNLALLLVLLPQAGLVHGQEISQYQHWLDLVGADQAFADRVVEIGRNRAFLEFLGEGSVVFRDGPVDALERYAVESNQREIQWEAHYVDVSRDGDMGLSAGPMIRYGQSEEPDTFGHLVSFWRKNGERWQLMSDIVVPIPGFLSLEVEPNFDDTRPVLAETAHPVMADVNTNTLQSLIDADITFGRNINFRGGQRALLRYGMDNARVYLPGMAAAVGAEAASSVYGAFLDNLLFTTNPISLTNDGGYLSTSKDMGYTYGTMEAVADEDAESGFRAGYMRLWRFTQSNEWRIAVEVLSPY